jgi:prolyl-tRNA synthetase
MRWSQLFIPTLREAPADAEVASHIFLLRAGYVRQVAAGIYSFLPLAQRVMNKIARIVREEMDAIGAQEFLLPALNPAELWQESGRWEGMGENMFRLKDRSNRDLCLGMTHEEVFTSIARNELRSYRQLPQIWYQIQTKFRDEPRPKSGILRVRQFAMKDSYSFDVDWEGLDVSYQKHHGAYCRIYDRCGLKYIIVEADSGAMGGSQSQEFMVTTDAGEDLIAHCECGYAANLEKASSQLAPLRDDAGPEAPQPVHTPDQKTIEEIAAFLKIQPDQQIKTMVYTSEGKPILALLRGDHQLNEVKLQAALGSEVRPARLEEIPTAMGAAAGSLGPVGVTQFRIVSDQALQGRTNLTCGANRDDYHLTGVQPGRDYQAEYFDIRMVQAGDPCLRCGKSLRISKALEVGHIFKLGTKYSISMGANILNANGQPTPLIMGSYGIGLERIMAAAVELFHDADGIIWPVPIAPFHCVVSVLSAKDSALMAAAEESCHQLQANGVEVLFDDRDERPGVKFKDADLIGIPFRINFGSKKFSQGIVELVNRSSRTIQDVVYSELIVKLKSLLGAAAGDGSC